MCHMKRSELLNSGWDTVKWVSKRDTRRPIFAIMLYYCPGVGDLERTSCIYIHASCPEGSVYYLSLTAYAVWGQHSSTVFRNWPRVRSGPWKQTRTRTWEQAAAPRCAGVGNRTDLLQRQDELVEASPLREARFVHRHVVEQRQHRDLVRRHPVFDTEHVGVHHSVRHHRVEVQTFVNTRHFNGAAVRLRRVRGTQLSASPDSAGRKSSS